jgi:hypothetical protein
MVEPPVLAKWEEVELPPSIYIYIVMDDTCYNMIGTDKIFDGFH